MMRDYGDSGGSGVAAPSSMVSRGGFFVQRPYFPSPLIDGRFDLDRENVGDEIIQITDVYERKPELIEEADIQIENIDETLPEPQIQQLKIKTVFPFIFFPDELIVNEDKVTIIKKTFFASEEIHTIPIKDITDVIISCSLFFATMYIRRAFHNDLYNFSYIKKEEAFRARAMIQELIEKLTKRN